MTAGKHHAQLVVLDLLLEGRRFPGTILPEPQTVDELRAEVAELIVPPQKIDGPVAGHPHEPGGGIVGKAVNRPRLQGPAQRVLDHVLGQVEPSQPDHPGQIGDHLPRLAAEKMVDQSRDVFRKGPPGRTIPTWKRRGGPPPFRRLPGWDSPWPAPPPDPCPWPRGGCSPAWSPW